MVDQPRPVRHLRGVTVIGGGMVKPADLSVALSVAPLLVAPLLVPPLLDRRKAAAKQG